MTHNFLLKASLLYKDICPEESRFLLQRHQTIAAALPQSLICPFCFEWRTLGNHHVRLRPKRKPTARIRRLLKRESAGKRLSAEQTAVLQKFKRASNALMATCHTCNKVSRQPGMNRELLVSLSKHRSTPGSASKHRTPQSVNWATPKSVANRTPSSTPRSASSNTSSSSSSKSSSVKSSPFARLKKILMLENKQQGKKGGLKHFLSSLWRPQSCRWKKKDSGLLWGKLLKCYMLITSLHGLQCHLVEESLETGLSGTERLLSFLLFMDPCGLLHCHSEVWDSFLNV